MNDRAHAGDRRIGADDEIGEDVAKRAVGVEIRVAAIDAAAHDEAVAMVEQPRLIDGLQRAADRIRLDVGPVDGPVRNRRAGVSGARRTGNWLIVRIQDHKLVAERERRGAGERHRPWKAVVLKTQPVGKRRRVAAPLKVAVIAVNVGLLEPARVHGPLQ